MRLQPEPGQRAYRARHGLQYLADISAVAVSNPELPSASADVGFGGDDYGGGIPTGLGNKGKNITEAKTSLQTVHSS